MRKGLSAPHVSKRKNVNTNRINGTFREVNFSIEKMEEIMEEVINTYVNEGEAPYG